MAGGVLEDTNTFGYPIRNKLFEGESQFFSANPDVAGMASETGDIILNPNPQTGVNQAAVAQNEGFRLLLKDKQPNLNFTVTDAQKENFKGTIYENNPQALRETILARIVSGDPSSGTSTNEQRQIIKSLLQPNNKTERAEMPQNNFNVNDELLKLVQQQAQPQRQPVLNTGLLSGTQQNFGVIGYSN